MRRGDDGWCVMHARKENNVVQMRLFRDIPDPGPQCDLCHGERIVVRDQKSVLHQATFTRYQGHVLESFEVDVETIVGGVDACPRCAARAEAEYRSRMD